MKPYAFLGSCFAASAFFFLGLLLCCLALCVLNHAFLMLLAHVVDLHAGQGTKGQRLLDGKTRIVGVNVYFYDITSETTTMESPMDSR